MLKEEIRKQISKDTATAIQYSKVIDTKISYFTHTLDMIYRRRTTCGCTAGDVGATGSCGRTTGEGLTGPVMTPFGKMGALPAGLTRRGTFRTCPIWAAA